MLRFPLRQAGRSLAAMHEELAEQGQVQTVPAVRLRDYLGASCLLAHARTAVAGTTTPCAAGIRQTLSLTCLMPLASAYLHTKCNL